MKMYIQILKYEAHVSNI